MLIRVILTTVVAGWLGSYSHAGCTAPISLESGVQTHPSAKTYTDLGIWFDKKKDYSCAIQAYRSALNLSTSPRLLELFGASLASSGELNRAIDGAQQSVKQAPNTLVPHLELATALEEAGRKNDANAEWESALKIDPQSKAALHGFCRHAISENNYAVVIDRLTLVQRDEYLTLDLAEAYWKSGMRKDADDLLTAALAKSPGSLPLTEALATVQVDEGLREKALQTAEQSAVSHPQDPGAQKFKLRMLLANNDTAIAYPLARKLLRSSPRDAYLLYALGVMESQNGQFQAARNHLEQVIALRPDLYNSHYQLGLVLAKLNDPEGARGHFEKALALGAREPEVHLELANVLRKLGATEEAGKQLQLYREASETESSRSVAEGKASLAERELASGDPRKAATLYREALESTPNDALLNYKLSVALDKAGDTAGERTALEKALELDPDMAIAHNQVGYLLSRGGDLVSSEEHFRQAVRSAPTFTDAWINLAATLGMESKFQEAQDAVNTALKLDPKNEQALHLRDDLITGQTQH